MTKKTGKPTVRKAGPKSRNQKSVRRAPVQKVVEDNTDYEVEAIYGVQRVSKHYSDVDVLIKWVGWPKATWETLENAKHSADLLKPFKRAIDRISGKIKLPDEDDAVEDDEDTEAGSVDGKNKEYEVEDIIGIRYSKEDKRIEYLVKWKSWSYDQCTWEPRRNVEELPQYLEFFQEAADQLEANTNTAGSSSKKRRFEDSDNEDNADESQENGAGDTGSVSSSKRGRPTKAASKPGPASRKKKPVANGTPSRSSRRSRN